MTARERRNPKLLHNPSRVRRIARGSGTTPKDVQQLVKQFGEMQKMMKRMGMGGKKGKRGMPSFGGRGAMPDMAELEQMMGSGQFPR
jgi:signal recognition particle subunit SRP54